MPDGPPICVGINGADPLDRPARWVVDNNIPSGLFNHGSWTVLVSDDRKQVHHPECTGTCVEGKLCCSVCASMWLCVNKYPLGSTKPAFYRHVTNLCRNRAFDIPTCTFRAAAIKRRVRARDSNSTIPVIKTLSKRWSGLTARDQDLLTDQVRNMGRVGKSKCGNRWSSSSKAMCMRLNLTIGWRQLSNMCLPVRRTINELLPNKYAPIGLQPAVYTSFGGFFKTVDVTLSGDDLSLNGAVNVIVARDKHVLVGNANALDTCKHGPATVYSFTNIDDAPKKSDIPIATNVLIHVIHSPTTHSPTVATHLFPHNGLQLEDYLLVLHTIEQAVPVSNIGYDNYSCQLQIKSGCMRPFTAQELEYLKLKADEYGGREPDLCAFAEMAVAMVRPVSIVMQHFLMHTSSSPPTLPVPYPYVTNFSCISSKHMCVSPEYRHTLRLWVKHFRDKRSKLIVWDFKTFSALTFMDVYTLYVHRPANSGLRFQCIDQSDSTLNNDRAYDLHQFPLVQSLIRNVYGAQSTALHLFIGSAYLTIFRGGIGKLAGIVLAHFCSCALVSQRVMVLKSKGLTLQAHSYTTPTTVAMFQDCAGYIYMVLKRNGSRSFDPAHCGEWQNEALNAKLRCPGTMQFTSNVSMFDVQQRLSRIQCVEQLEAAGLSSGLDTSTSVPEPELSNEAVHCAMLLGWELWCKVAHEYGMGDLVKIFPCYSLLFSEHLRLSKPEISKVITWKAWSEWIQKQKKVSPPPNYTHVAARAQFQDELRPFFDTYDMLLDRNTHKSGHTAVDMPVLQDVVVDEPRSDLPLVSKPATAHRLVINSFVAHTYNDDLRGQTKHITGRFATQDHLRGNPMSTAKEADNAVCVGQTYAFIFEVDSDVVIKGRKRHVVEQHVYIGMIRSIVAAMKEGAKGRRSLVQVDGQDQSAVYYCYPYAKVVLSGKSKLVFEMMEGEVPTYFALTKGCTVDDMAEGEAGEARDGDDMEPETRRSRPGQGSNLKESLNVEWTQQGPVLLDAVSKSVLLKRVRSPERECE